MTLRRRLEVTDAARAQILAASAWWEQHRPKAPGAVAEELDRILALLVAQPEIGVPARRTRLADVRRIALTRIRYYLYYRATDTAIQVLALWHTSRGKEPPLP